VLDACLQQHRVRAVRCRGCCKVWEQLKLTLGFPLLRLQQCLVPVQPCLNIVFVCHAAYT
jgi:hypothetical protein